MNNQDNKEDRVLKYLDGELSENEKQLFEKELKTDNELNELYKVHQEINKYINDREAHTIKAKLAEARIRYDNRELKKKKLKRFYRAAAIFIVLVSVAGIIFWLTNSDTPLTNNELYSQYYTTYSTTIEYRNDTSVLTGDYYIALSEYDKGAYEQALIYFEEIIQKEQNGSSAQFFAGICCMEMGEFDRAIQYFKATINSNNTLFIDQARWFLALCYVRTGDIEKARSILNDLSQISRFKQTEVLELLEHL